MGKSKLFDVANFEGNGREPKFGASHMFDGPRLHD
jgi:hypothetical protein